MRRRLRRARHYLRSGLWYDYPLCCVLGFAAAPLLGVDRQAARRGVVELGGPRRYVPCLWHSRCRRPEGWRPHDCMVRLYQDGRLVQEVDERQLSNMPS